MIPLKVLGDRVLIRPDVLSNAPETTESGVVIAKSLAAAVMGEDATTSVCRGTVIAVGMPKHPLKEEAETLGNRLAAHVCDPADMSTFEETLHDASLMLRDLVRRQPCCAIGDDVLFSRDAGQELTLDDEVVLLLREDELLAIVEPEKEVA